MAFFFPKSLAFGSLVALEFANSSDDFSLKVLIQLSYLRNRSLKLLTKRPSRIIILFFVVVKLVLVVWCQLKPILDFEYQIQVRNESSFKHDRNIAIFVFLVHRSIRRIHVVPSRNENWTCLTPQINQEVNPL